MSCMWRQVSYSYPPPGISLLVKYNILRSDYPFEYVVAKYKNGWVTDIFLEGVRKEVSVPTPDWWALIEPEDDHA